MGIIFEKQANKFEVNLNFDMVSTRFKNKEKIERKKS